MSKTRLEDVLEMEPDMFGQSARAVEVRQCRTDGTFPPCPNLHMIFLDNNGDIITTATASVEMLEEWLHIAKLIRAANLPQEAGHA